MTRLTASLPMYNLPEMAAANDAFWHAILAALRADGVTEAPDLLVRDSPAVPDAINPGTFFTQTCGYPLQTRYRGHFQLLGVPTYDAPGCGPATHRAYVLVRNDAPARTIEDLRGGIFALNSRHSNSGMNLPRLLFAKVAGGRPFFTRIVETGGHPASMALVAAGGADAASVDCVTYAFLRNYRPAAVAQLRILAETADSPAIPFITRLETPPTHVASLQRALAHVVADPAARDTLAAVRLRTITPPDPAAYAGLMAYEREAASLGYPEIA